MREAFAGYPALNRELTCVTIFSLWSHDIGFCGCSIFRSRHEFTLEFGVRLRVCPGTYVEVVTTGSQLIAILICVYLCVLNQDDRQQGQSFVLAYLAILGRNDRESPAQTHLEAEMHRVNDINDQNCAHKRLSASQKVLRSGVDLTESGRTLAYLGQNLPFRSQETAGLKKGHFRILH